MPTSRHLRINLSKVKDKEKMLEVAGGKKKTRVTSQTT
jgi:hypothetical protein